MRRKPGDDWMYWKHGDRRVKGSRWLLVGILLLAGALRLAHAGAASLWFDEAFAVSLMSVFR